MKRTRNSRRQMATVFKCECESSASPAMYTWHPDDKLSNHDFPNAAVYTIRASDAIVSDNDVELEEEDGRYFNWLALTALPEQVYAVVRTPPCNSNPTRDIGLVIEILKSKLPSLELVADDEGGKTTTMMRWQQNIFCKCCDWKVCCVWGEDRVYIIPADNQDLSSLMNHKPPEVNVEYVQRSLRAYMESEDFWCFNKAHVGRFELSFKGQVLAVDLQWKVQVHNARLMVDVLKEEGASIDDLQISFLSAQAKTYTELMN